MMLSKTLIPPLKLVKDLLKHHKTKLKHALPLCRPDRTTMKPTNICRIRRFQHCSCMWRKVTEIILQIERKKGISRQKDWSAYRFGLQCYFLELSQHRYPLVIHTEPEHIERIKRCYCGASVLSDRLQRTKNRLRCSGREESQNNQNIIKCSSSMLRFIPLAQTFQSIMMVVNTGRETAREQNGLLF